jgi:hypothetical protein
LSETGTPADLWYFVSNNTEIDRDVCKMVIYRMLFGTDLVEAAIECGLTVDEMVNIRMAFDQYTHEHKKEDNAVHQAD